MPPSRRSGTAHSSKARGSSSSHAAGRGHASSSSAVETQAGPSSPSRTRHLVEEEKEDHAETEEAMAGRTNAERVRTLLAQFERQPQALTMDVSDAKLKTLRSDWATMESNFEIAFQLITQAGERLADSLAADGIVDEDEDLQELDEGMRAMIDLKESVKNRRQALAELRGELAEGKSITNAEGNYKEKVQVLEDDYKQKTLRQRYAQSQSYKDYRKTVWDALRDDEMPPLVDLLPPEADEVDEDADDDVVMYGGDRQKFKCPLTLQIMVDPLKSTLCQHAFEKQSILDYLDNTTKQCPTGCPASLNKRHLIEDIAFTRACRKFARREQRRRETQRTQAQATMLD